MRSLLRHPDYYKKKIYIFFNPGPSMRGKGVSFEDKKIKKIIFTKTKRDLRYMT